MVELNIVPYLKLEDQYYTEEVTINIIDAAFYGIAYKEGDLTYTIEGCKFESVCIKNIEVVNFKDISISFVGCYIKRLEVEQIVSKNISFRFHASIVSGQIANNNLLSVHLNNCCPMKGLFLLNQNSVTIEYTEDNIFPRRWKKLLDSLNTKGSYLMQQKQSYYIHNTKQISFTSNESESEKRGFYTKDHQVLKEYKLGYYLNEAEKSLLDIHLSIQYAASVPHTETKISGSHLNALSLSGHANAQKYKYNGKEFQDELGLNLYDYGWRNYDYAIGRFMSIDPLAEKYTYQSPYNFSENRVIDSREFEGLEKVSIHLLGKLSSNGNSTNIVGNAKMDMAKNKATFKLSVQGIGNIVGSYSNQGFKSTVSEYKPDMNDAWSSTMVKGIKIPDFMAKWGINKAKEEIKSRKCRRSVSYE